MKIKQLVWNGGIFMDYAESPLGHTYQVFPKQISVRDNEGWEIASIPFGGCIEDAKAAAQADFEKRVMACFEEVSDED